MFRTVRRSTRSRHDFQPRLIYESIEKVLKEEQCDRHWSSEEECCTQSARLAVFTQQNIMALSSNTRE
jgi:hypothetical protein